MKKFICEAFGGKSDYSGYDRDSWPLRTHELHKEQVSKFRDAHTAANVLNYIKIWKPQKF